MKRFLLVLFLAVGMIANSQTYVTSSLSYYNGKGTFSQQAEPVIEVGRYLQEDFTVGLAQGFTSFSKGNYFLELRPTFYYTSGKLSQGFTIGAGYIFNSPSSMLVEWSTSTNYQFNKRGGVGIFIGAYNFNGKLFASEYSFSGLSFTYTFKK